MGNYLAPYMFDDSKSVLSHKYSGGPHGLGDPDDKSLRVVERDVLIQRIISERARNEYCRDQMLAVIECSKDKGFNVLWKCKPQSRALETCLEEARVDEDLRERCTQEYLDRRSEYRRTGVKEKNKQKYGPKVFLPPVGDEQHV